MNRSFFEPGNLSTRFLCYFGHTGDLFADEMLCPQNIEFSLHRLLKAAGYERVVYYGYSRGAYFLDAESQGLWHGRKKSTKTQSLFGNTPKLMGRLQPQPAADTGNQSPMSFNVGASEMLHVAESFLRDTTIRTALVFPNGMEALKEFSTLDQGKMLDNFFVRVTETSISQQDNFNTAVFVFNRTQEQMESFLSDRARESLRNYLLRPGFATLHYIGLPGREEIRRMLNYLRLWGDGKKRLQVDCSQLDAISDMLSRTMAANYARRQEKQTYDPALLQTWLLNDTMSFLTRHFVRKEKSLTLESCRTFCRRDSQVPALERLEALVGMESVKESIRSFVRHAAARKKEPIPEAASRLDRGPAMPKEEKLNLHFVLTGNQGTGKTTVAEHIGEILCEAGLLSTGQTVKVTPGKLLDSRVGGSEQNLIQAVEDAMGGVLFIDEAYDLAKPEASGIVTQLLDEMVSRRGSFSVILAGYRHQIEDLFDPKKGANPGLKSRFGNQILHIEDYTVEELEQIFRLKAAKQGLTLSEELEALLPTFLRNWYYDKKRSGWANGREMENLLQGMTVGREVNGVLEVSMIPREYESYTSGKAGEDALAKLDQMIGLDRMKEEIKRMRRRRENGWISGMQHFLFAGPPGTGKTTVARYMGMILKNMGVLESGHLVEVVPNDLVGQYRGETAVKAREVFESAKDGVLFIDEAYGLIPDKEEGHDFRGAVIDELLKYIDPDGKKGPLCVICAGYEEELKELLACNKGLERRFKTWIPFDSYSPQELLEILKQVLKKEGFQAEEGYLEAALQNFREHIGVIADKHNAGYIRRYLEASLDRLGERLERMYGKKIPEAEKWFFRAEDAPGREDCL